jgi:hypothetical protein
METVKEARGRKRELTTKTHILSIYQDHRSAGNENRLRMGDIKTIHANN